MVQKMTIEKERAFHPDLIERKIDSITVSRDDAYAFLRLLLFFKL